MHLPSLIKNDPSFDEPLTEQEIDNILSIYLLMLIAFPEDFVNN